MSTVLVSDFDHYVKLIEGEKRLIIVDFSATWCAPCKKFLPILDQLSTQYPDQLLILKVDADQDRQLEEEKRMFPLFTVQSLPTIVFVKNSTFQKGDEFRIQGFNLPKFKKALQTLGNFSSMP